MLSAFIASPLTRQRYHQAHMPIVKQPTIEGHSVRAMYLLTAYADLIRLRGVGNSETQYTALVRLWDNMVNCKMSLTGGIGAQDKWEGFGIDYFLPQSTDEGGCYNETCAGIGVMMLAERLLQIDLDGRFADVMELCFYNTVLTGMSSCGTRFTYVNQLASSDKDLSKREEWFTCACCPPNVTRLLGYIGGYLWTHFSDVDRKTLEIHVHMYGSATLRVPHGKQHVELHQSSNWPWSGNLNFRLSSPVDVATTVKLRIPKWADRWTVCRFFCIWDFQFADENSSIHHLRITTSRRGISNCHPLTLRSITHSRWISSSAHVCLHPILIQTRTL